MISRDIAIKMTWAINQNLTSGPKTIAVHNLTDSRNNLKKIVSLHSTAKKNKKIL